MKNLKYKKLLHAFQIILSFTSLILFITNTIHNNILNIWIYYIAALIYATPITTNILCLMFCRK